MTSLLAIVILIDAAIGAWIGNAKGRGPLGMVLGGLLGCIGWIIMACLPATYDKQLQREVTRQRLQAEAGRITQEKISA